MAVVLQDSIVSHEAVFLHTHTPHCGHVEGKLSVIGREKIDGGRVPG